MIPLGGSKFAVVDEVDLIPALLLCAWTQAKGGYVIGSQGYLHIWIAKRMGLNLTQTIDHIDRDVLNCKRKNLREASLSLQMQNRGLQKSNKTGYKWIAWNKSKNKYHVKGNLNGRSIFIAYCDSIEEAVQKRNAYITKHNLTLIED